MPRCLHHIDGKFCLWSTIVDAYVGPPMTLRETLVDRDVAQSYEEAADRIDRAKANGCSMVHAEDRCSTIHPFPVD